MHIDCQNRESVTLGARQIPVAAHVDVLVAGGGPAGFGAALGAARQGANTLLIERDPVLGGVATLGGMNTWNVPPEKMTGIAREVADALIASGKAVAGPTIPFEVEALKTLMLEWVSASGARLLMHTVVVEPLTDGDRVIGALIAGKAGLQAVLAGTVVDATGDADLVAAAGGETVKGRESDGKMRPISVLFRLGGIDMGLLLEHVEAHPDDFSRDPAFHILRPDDGLVRICGFFDLMAQAQAQGQIAPDINYIRFEGVQVAQGIVTVNNSRVYGVDGTDPWALTQADLEARRQNAQLQQLITRHIPGCEDAYLIDSSIVAVRETRRIRGSSVLTEEDITSQRTYATAVARLWRHHAAGADWHSPDGGEGGPANDTYRTAATPLTWLELPWEIFCPNGVRGIIVGGRTLSQTQRADMYTRGQYACMVTGQVAGTAAALAAAQGAVPGDLDVSTLQQALVAAGVDIGEAGALP